jgi:type II secretory pathway component PulK
MRRTRRKGRYFSQRGVALLAAVMAIAVTSVMVKEFATNTTIDFIAATNARESMKAHFHARSGANLAQLLIRVQTDVLDRYRQFLGDVQIGDYSNLLMGAFGGTREEVGALGDLIGVDVSSVEGLGLDEGSFDVQITSEDGKINLNCANGSEQVRENLFAQLQALFYFDAYNPIFESESADRWRRTREEQAQAIIDYIDRDSTIFGQRGVSEQYGYENLDDPYEAKNNYIDTLGEVRLIRGVDDRFWTLFGDHFTVYGDCKINISEVSNPRLIASIILLSAEDPEHPVLRDQARLWELARTAVEAQDLGISFTSLDAFSAFVENPGGGLEQLFAAQFGDEAAGAHVDPQTGQEVLGVALDADKLNQIARAGTRRMYRVTATAQLGNVEKRVVGVWDTNTHNQNMRDPAYGRGTWVFWREE